MYTHAFQVAAGTVPTQVNAQGTYIRYVSAASGVTNPRIRVKPDSGDAFDLLPGQAMKLARRSTFFSILNVDGVGTITGVLAIGDGQMDDSRVSGEVLMVDGTYSRSLAIRAFATQQSIGPVAGQYSHLQLFNTVGNNVYLVVYAIRMALLAAGNALLHINHTGAPMAGTTTPYPKRAGAAVASPVGQMQSTNNALIQGTPIMYSSVEQSMKELRLVDPIIIEPGRGLCAACGTVNLGMAGSFEYYIEPI